MKHTHWVYVFRFLKASLYLQSPNPSESIALENLRAIAGLANQRGDISIFVVANLLEGLSLLKSVKDDTIVRIQNCIAQASKYQFESSAQTVQLEILALMLDLACSFHQKSPQIIAQKVKSLQARLDSCINDEAWGMVNTQLVLPIRKQSIGMQVVSDDTSSILKPGAAHEPWDYFVMSFWSKIEAFTVTWVFALSWRQV